MPHVRTIHAAVHAFLMYGRHVRGMYSNTLVSYMTRVALPVDADSADDSTLLA